MKFSPFLYSGKNALQVAMPIGGLGAGNVCLSGFGSIRDYSIRHRPDNSCLPDHHGDRDAAFALLHIRGPKPVTRLLEGPIPPEMIYDQGLQAQGHRNGDCHEGLPRFRSSVFAGEFPFGHVLLEDPEVPLRARVTGFNPFIPLDDKNSGLPCAILEYTFENRTEKKVEFEFSFHLSHLCREGADRWRGTRSSAIPGRGVFFTNTEDVRSEAFGSACLMALTDKVKFKAEWFRGGWFDSGSMIWKEVSTGNFQQNTGREAAGADGRNGGSILFEGSVPARGSVTFPLVMAWHFPNTLLTVPLRTTGECCESSGCDAGGRVAWRPYYAGVWSDAREVAAYVRRNYSSLRQRTAAFKDALFSSTLPREVLDAVSSNLAILKSPTLLRQENGNVWGWEGCFCHDGCCSGSCTHVWNYAQSLCHLFPALERTLREQEMLRSLNEDGHANFRSALPDGPVGHGAHAAADGQLGGILKTYRDWQICGDSVWLRNLYPQVRLSLEYCIRTWDPARKGLLVEPHHNTYDIEFWGPDGMCSSVYVSALSAMSAMAASLGETDDARAYGNLARRGAALMDQELYNGEFYHQKVRFKNMRDPKRDQSINDQVKDAARTNPALARLLCKEGPKYQYGDGCLSDGIIGAWMAELYGVETPMNRNHVRSTLRAIHKHNFRRDLSRHVNCQRPGYALGPEAGLLICSWPRGGKPSLPFVYSDEVWTGIEYQVASHLILEGMVKAGLEIVKAARSRFKGHARNPYNEYECGSFYARAMSSYSLLASLSGFRYSAVDQTLRFGPKLKKRPFVTFFSTAAGFGTISLDKTSLLVSVIEGQLAIKRIILDLGKSPWDLVADAVAKPGHPVRFSIPKSTTRKTGNL